jgi:hypothetical protein
MRTPFDIFTDSPVPQPVWIESDQDLEEARERLSRRFKTVRPPVRREDNDLVPLMLRLGTGLRLRRQSDGKSRH